MHAFLRFPNFRRKALTFSYDDGTVFDKRLVEIFNKYGLKGTFNLNSGSFGQGRRLGLDELRELFSGSEHEVAVHGVNHLSLTEVDSAMATSDIINDRLNLERDFGGIIRGMAYANGDYNDKVIELLKGSGIVYSRTTQATHKFDIPTNWLALHPTCHHRDAMLNELADKFLSVEEAKYCWRNCPELFYVWGHSYEFNDSDNWEIIEAFAEKMSGKDYIWYATNIEIYDYVKAFEALVFSANGKTVHNPSAIDVYCSFKGKNTLIKAGETVEVQY